MRILHTGDWHLGKNLEGQSRMDEQELFLKDFIDIVEENKVDALKIIVNHYHEEEFPFGLELLPVTSVLRLKVLEMTGKRRNNRR